VRRVGEVFAGRGVDVDLDATASLGAVGGFVRALDGGERLAAGGLVIAFEVTQGDGTVLP
jgi:hypothetical protein